MNDALEALATFASTRAVRSEHPYVPILRLRRGEVAGLHNVSSYVQGRLAPVFVVPPTRTAGADAEELDAPERNAMRSARDLLRRLVSGAALFEMLNVKTIWLDCWPLEADLGRPVFAELLATFTCPERIVPVIRAEQDLNHRLAASRHHLEFGTGIMIRISDFDWTIALDIARTCGVPVNSVDVLVDASLVTAANVHATSKKLERLLRACCTVSWRSITVVGGSLAEPFAFRDGERFYERLEMALWRSAVLAIPGVRLGDYVTLAPVFLEGPARAPLPNIRFTLRTKTMILKRARDPVSSRRPYQEMCSIVDVRRRVEAIDVDWGTAQIADCSAGVPVKARSSLWTAVGVSHHIEFVSRQISKGF